VFFVKSVKHTFYTLHTIIPDFGDVRKLTGYSPFTLFCPFVLDIIKLISDSISLLSDCEIFFVFAWRLLFNPPDETLLSSYFCSSIFLENTGFF